MLEHMADDTAVAETGEDAASSFAALMAGAAEQATDPAPYGYTRDRATGETRPKKSPGRGGARKSPSLDELKASKEEAAAEQGQEPAADRAPAKPDRRTRKRSAAAERQAEPVPPYKQGVIAAGVNKLYRRAGKIVRVMDADIGTAIIETTRKVDEDDVTVGEAWEELAKTNPRIRRFLMKAIAGGAWGQLVAAHAPIFMAVLMKDAVAKRIPFMRVAEAFLGPDEDGPSEMSEALGGLQPEDAGQMMAMAQQLAAQMAAGMPRGAGGMRVPPATFVYPDQR